MHRLPVVDDFMDRTFETVTPETRINVALNVLVKKRLTGVLVVDDDRNLVGILSEKDCLKILLHDGFYRLPDDKVSNYMHVALRTVESNMDIISVAQVFLANTFRRIPVVDSGKLVGQITRRDIIKGMEKYFQEVQTA